jgi:YVTN family beta-propeller protein
MIRLSPREGRVYVTNLLSNPVASGQPCRNEITVIDDVSARVIDRIMLENANIGRGIAFTADGSLGIVAVSRPKNLIPMVQVARGWVVTNGFAIVSVTGDTPPVQLLVDLPNQAFSDPHAIVLTPDDRKFYLSCAGMDTVIAVDLERVREVVADAAAGRINRPSDNLGLSRRYVTARIGVGANPQALAVSRDGRWLYAANRLDDTISVIDTAVDRVTRTLVIGERASPDRLLRGERFFHSAARTFQGQFSCASCHPDTGFDGLQYDLEPDGIGENILDNRNLRDIAGTAPFKWVGTNPDITTQCGTRTAKWIMRTGWLSSAQVVDLATYIRSIEPVFNPYKSRDGKLTAAQRRGKALFERTTANDGTPIPERDRCSFCHSGARFFDARKADVGTKGPHDSRARFDTAHLINVFESPPYLHDGRAATLEEVWTKHNPRDKHGFSSDWTKQQLNDLMEYLKSL